jgi:hypothetical protein
MVPALFLWLFLPGPWSSYLCFLPSLGWQAHATVTSSPLTSHPLRWGITNCFVQTGLELPSSWSQSPAQNCF